MQIFLYTIIFIMGCFFGCFCTLAVHRIPKREDILIKHSSDFGVISQPGKGSDFWFDLERVPKKEAELDKSKKN